MTDHLTRLREMREIALAGGGPERVADQKAKGKGTARERLSLPARRGLLPGDRRPRHPRLHRLRHGREALPRRRGRLRVRQDQRPAGRRLRPRLHRPRRLLLRRAVAEDLPAPGPGARERDPADRPQRLGRRAHPGGRPQPGRLRRGVHAQRAVLRGHPADLGRARALRGRRGLLAGAHRLRDHDRAPRARCSSPGPR